MCGSWTGSELGGGALRDARADKRAVAVMTRKNRNQGAFVHRDASRNSNCRVTAQVNSWPELSEAAINSTVFAFSITLAAIAPIRRL